MRGPTPGKSLINAKLVLSVLPRQDIWGDIKDAILERNLTNAKTVT